MVNNRAQKIFEKYNPADEVRRCPNGRAFVRKNLDTYAKAAVNLYGIISKAEFVEIFNRQNTEQTNTDELFTLLLPLVLKSKWYCFYKEYIVHYWAIDDFDYAEYWLKEQGDKPRFIPEKVEFLKFENEHYESEIQDLHWSELHTFIYNEWPDNYKRILFYRDLKDIARFSVGMKKVSELLEEYNIVFDSENQAQTFFSLFMEARNNTRLWSNKGYSPKELMGITAKNRQKGDSSQVIIQKRTKVGVNDPCPCGSGKKYKKCCRLIDEAKTAQLSPSECQLFYETWYGLMGFINEQKKIINAKIKPIYPNPISDEQIYKIREVFWQNPKLIDDYLGAATLSEEKIELLKSWRDHHKKGMYFLVDYKPEYAVAIGITEQKDDRLYGIKGIRHSLADTMQRELPIQFETVLLPFKDVIIFDSFISSMPIGFAEGAKKLFREMYENALPHGIITCLGENAGM